MENSTKSLAIPCIEKQQCNPASFYEPKTALFEGTVFPELNLTFFATESLEESSSVLSNATGEAEKLLNEITMEGFILDDLILYLDTHDDDKEVLKIFNEHLQKKEDLAKEFAEKYFPLTRHFIPYCKKDCGCFSWKAGKPAWEGACC